MCVLVSKSSWRRLAVATVPAIMGVLMLASCSQKSAPPTPSATSPKAAKVGKIVFGADVEKVDPAKNNGRPHKIVKPASTFKADDSFAYLAMCEEPFKQSDIETVWYLVLKEGEEKVVLHETLEVADPEKHKNAYYHWDKASELMDDWDAGKYKLRYFRNDTLLAEGEFSYSGS